MSLNSIRCRWTALVKKSLATGTAAAREAAGKNKISLADFAALISPAGSEILETLGRRAHAMTQQRFGKTIRLFAPLYLSNECINNCSYCGFSRDNPILRVTLSLDEVRREAQALKEQGFRNLLLVAGEHPKFVSNGYLRDCIAALHADWPSISLEVGPMETEDYRPLVAAGADGLVVYQETYDRKVYAEMHTAGPKRNFDWRLETPERAYAAGFRRLGISPLYGLADWRFEALSAAAHADYLLRNCWKAALTISTVRMRPCAGEFEPLTHISDRELAQLICAHPADVSRCRHRAFDARNAEAARRPDSARRDDDERRRAHRAGRLHRRGQGKNPSHRARHHQGTGVRRERMGAAGKPPDERDRPVQHRRRTPAAAKWRNASASSATSRCGKIGTRR